MRLTDIIERAPDPGPWEEGRNIPWDDPDFSRRMLAEHLSQQHDKASRRLEAVDRHVEWIHGALLSGRPSRILDLCCGPGLYTTRLAALGHDCVGIDFSPASVDHADRLAAELGVNVRHVHGDVRDTQFGDGYDLVMMIFGELNVFPRAEAVNILTRAGEALVPGGLLLLEPQREEIVKDTGVAAPSWYGSAGGLFSERPHVCLVENFWDTETRTATTRFFVIDAATARVDSHAMTAQAYSEGEYAAMLAECGFDGGDFMEGLPGTPEESAGGLLAIVARKSE